jgi:hypothetical protein
VQEKKSVTFWPLVFHREIHRQQRFACGKRVRVIRRRGFSPDIERTLDDRQQPRSTALRAWENAGGSTVKPPACASPAGYPSSVCSNTGDAIDRVAAAIDQLASDVHGSASEPELAARVAGLWQMVSDLDPELARRTRGYTALPGGGTSD